MPSRPKCGCGKRSKTRIGVQKKRNRKSEMKVTLKCLYDSIASFELGCGWHDNTPEGCAQIRLCEVTPGSEAEALNVSKCVLVNPNLSWAVHIHDGLLDCNNSTSLHTIPDHLDVDSFRSLVTLIDSMHVCQGNSDTKYIEMLETKEGKIISGTGETSAYLDTKFQKTIRHSNCTLLIEGEDAKCFWCSSYRDNLRSIYSNYSKEKEPSMKSNLRYLNRAQTRRRYQLVRRALRNKQRQLQRMKCKLDGITEKHGVMADDNLQSDLMNVFSKHQEEINKLPCDDFKRVFWEQQTATLKCKSKKGNRWLPLFIRWCLNIMLSSPRTYDIIRDSGFIALPSRRTLRDYSNCMKIKLGFQSEVFTVLRKEAKIDDLPEWKRNMVLAFDEMKIREDLVFNKGGDIIGFVKTEDMDNKLRELEQNMEEDHVADHMLALMVRGIFLKFDFEFAQFPTRGLTGLQLHDIMWGAVRRLAEIGINVVCFVCDGGKPNRKFLRTHKSPEGTRDGIVYKVRNMYDTSKFVYFMSDVPHLMKTTRNCWSSSCSDGTRYLWNNGNHILWAHLHGLHKICSTRSGMYVSKKLRYEHLHLTSYSRMRVRLAVQVLSKAVADGLVFCRDLNLPSNVSAMLADTTETEKFCRMFDKFFDCLNTRSLVEAKRKRKPDLNPYYSSKDSRLEWLNKDFIGYLNEWEQSVSSREISVSDADKQRMLLSKETRDGLRMTVYSFTELVPLLLEMTGPKFILSTRFNQDPLEIYFSKQRARGGRNDNPSAHQFLQNVQAIRIGKSLSFGHCSNIEKRKLEHNVEELSKPLPKRKALSRINQ